MVEALKLGSADPHPIAGRGPLAYAQHGEEEEGGQNRMPTRRCLGVKFVLQNGEVHVMVVESTAHCE